MSECNCILKGDHRGEGGLCNEKSDGGNLCSKPQGHDGPHSACTTAVHPVETWGEGGGDA